MVDTTFIDELSSAAPTPGGGGASAYCGALASALASMVANLTVGKKKYAAVEEDMQDALAALEILRGQLIDLIEKDAEAFAPLAAAYGMPRETPEQQQAKNDALQYALVGACEAPLQIMEACAQVIDLCDVVARQGSRMAVSDAGVAAAFGKAALQGASLNVFINAKSMDDRQQAQAYTGHAYNLIMQFGEQADSVFDYVMKEIQ